MENNTQETSRRIFKGFDPKLWGTRLAYAGGDVACNIVFGMVGTLLTFFYTHNTIVPIGLITTLMLVSRVFDGFSDIIMGILVEKTHSRFGKARPWLLWMALPFAASAVLLFCVPDVKNDLMWVQAIYIFVTYNFCSTVCYTAVNLPYGTLSTLMTDKSHERDMLGNVRMGLSPIGKIIAVSFTLPLVAIFSSKTGNEVYNDKRAWIITMSIWALLALILLLINFFFCRETVKKPEAKKEDKTQKQNKLPLKQGLKFLVTNKYFWLVLILWMFQSTSFGVIGTILPYYCENILLNANLYSTLFLVETLVLVGGVFICMPLVKKVGKRNLALFGSIIAVIGQVAFIFASMNSRTSLGLLYMSAITRSIGLAPLNAVVFGMLGDVVDFGHWKNGTRQEAFICAGGSVGTKLGSGLASVAIGQILSANGFDDNPLNAVNAIWWIYALAPLIVAVGVLITLYFYKLDKHYDAMMLALTKREWEKESKKKSVQRDIALVENKPIDIDPELAKMMKGMKPLEGKENPFKDKKITRSKKKK